mgnify:FL=1
MMISLFVSLMAPIFVLPFSYALYKRTPEKRNALYGFRTKRSLKSQATWIYANKFSGLLSMKISLALFPISIPISLYALHVNKIETVSIFSIYIQLGIILIPTIAITQYNLKRKFDDNGKPLKKNL